MTRDQKVENFRSMNRSIYRIAEQGTWNDLVEWRKEFNALTAENALLKSDAKILEKAEVYAEKQIFRSKRF